MKLLVGIENILSFSGNWVLQSSFLSGALRCQGRMPKEVFCVCMLVMGFSIGFRVCGNGKQAVLEGE